MTGALSSPMTSGQQHDTFALLHGSKEWAFPGIASVTASLKANLDTVDSPRGGTEVQAVQESSGEVEVRLILWTSEQWDKYLDVLKLLRTNGADTFVCAHPEVRARRIKQLYFESESASEYSPKMGYRVSLKFSEKKKEKPQLPTDTGQLTDPAGGGGTVDASTGRPTTAAGKSVYQEAMGHLPPDRPEPANGGRNNTAEPGFCSAWARVVGTRAGLPRSLFGESAKATESNFRAAGLSRPWDTDARRNLQKGDFVFWANDPSGYGHVGIVVGFAADGMPLIANNSSINRPDGRAINRMNALSTSRSQPTSYARAGGFTTAAAPRAIGPVAPVGAPSANVPGPR